jgi:AcrR family transcriptional regulator
MSPVKSRREQYSDATRAALLEAATRRFGERGFAGTALEDVAADIQATRGAVYHHFANKTALFQAVFEELETDLIRGLTEAIETAADPWDAAAIALDMFLDRSCDPAYSRIVWQEAPIALGWETWKQCEEKYAWALIQKLNQRLIDTGEVPALPLEPMTRITFNILGGAGMALAETTEAEKPAVKAAYFEVISTLLSGLRRTP